MGKETSVSSVNPKTNSVDIVVDISYGNQNINLSIMWFQLHYLKSKFQNTEFHSSHKLIFH